MRSQVPQLAQLATRTCAVAAELERGRGAVARQVVARQVVARQVVARQPELGKVCTCAVAAELELSQQLVVNAMKVVIIPPLLGNHL